ncbi:p6 [Beet pseudoyellows virus]|uniref:p6 n=1 Tax=Beet pseudoyellows virus TaxID=72750 RepID=Q6VRA4_9CLOS|nr:p6 [Beet pseudoyellows virus]AAQ97387.1 p6 [Beet pseudoyellows virus]UDP24118.1 p6 [Beet pseudoyellows virus]BAV38108.1 p6 protein [Beet pseudoyellows virus]
MLCIFKLRQGGSFNVLYLSDSRDFSGETFLISSDDVTLLEDLMSHLHFIKTQW